MRQRRAAVTIDSDTMPSCRLSHAERQLFAAAAASRRRLLRRFMIDARQRPFATASGAAVAIAPMPPCSHSFTIYADAQRERYRQVVFSERLPQLHARHRQRHSRRPAGLLPRRRRTPSVTRATFSAASSLMVHIP